MKPCSTRVSNFPTTVFSTSAATSRFKRPVTSRARYRTGPKSIFWQRPTRIRQKPQPSDHGPAFEPRLTALPITLNCRSTMRWTSTRSPPSAIAIPQASEPTGRPTRRKSPEIYADGFLPKFRSVEDDYQSVFGLKGKDVLGWDWDLSTSYGRNDVHYHNDDSLNASFGPDSPTDIDNGEAILASGPTTSTSPARSTPAGLKARCTWPAALNTGSTVIRSARVNTPPMPTAVMSTRWGRPTPVNAPVRVRPVGRFSPEAAGSWTVATPQAMSTSHRS